MRGEGLDAVALKSLNAALQTRPRGELGGFRTRLRLNFAMLPRRRVRQDVLGLGGLRHRGDGARKLGLQRGVELRAGRRMAGRRGGEPLDDRGSRRRHDAVVERPDRVGPVLEVGRVVREHRVDVIVEPEEEATEDRVRNAGRVVHELEQDGAFPRRHSAGRDATEFDGIVGDADSAGVGLSALGTVELSEELVPHPFPNHREQGLDGGCARTLAVVVDVCRLHAGHRRRRSVGPVPVEFARRQLEAIGGRERGGRKGDRVRHDLDVGDLLRDDGGVRKVYVRSQRVCKSRHDVRWIAREDVGFVQVPARREAHVNARRPRSRRGGDECATGERAKARSFQTPYRARAARAHRRGVDS